METSTYIILALIAIFLFGPVSLSTPLLPLQVGHTARSSLGMKTQR